MFTLSSNYPATATNLSGKNFYHHIMAVNLDLYGWWKVGVSRKYGIFGEDIWSILRGFGGNISSRGVIFYFKDENIQSYSMLI